MLQENPSVLDVRRYAASCKRKARRKTIKTAKKRGELDVVARVGTFWNVMTMTGIAPYNMKGKTHYLLEGGINCIGEKTKTGFRIYAIGGRTVTTVKELHRLVNDKIICKPTIARRKELKVREQITLA